MSKLVWFIIPVRYLTKIPLGSAYQFPSEVKITAPTLAEAVRKVYKLFPQQVRVEINMERIKDE